MGSYDHLSGDDRGLGEATRGARLMLSKESLVEFEGATNLLTKACTALDDGDAAKAERLINRAAAMPFNDYEERFPGVQMAVQLLYQEVTEAQEESYTDDATWLDVALDLLPTVDEAVRLELLSMLADMYRNPGLFEAEGTELARIRPLVKGAEIDPRHVAPDASVEERAAVITSILRGWLAYHRAFHHDD